MAQPELSCVNSNKVRKSGEVVPRLEAFQINEKVYQFDWNKKWLNGDEYHYILQNSEKYISYFQFENYFLKTHPMSIYQDPINGLLYFVEGLSLGSAFGFPRINNVKKKYKWKKMNFTTDLPKSNPLVSYIVASAVRCDKFFPGKEMEGPCFRMHAVVLKDQEMRKKLNKGKGYILCHIRKVNDTSSVDIEPIIPFENKLILNLPNSNSNILHLSNPHETQILKEKLHLALNNEKIQVKRFYPEMDEGYKEFSKVLSILASQYRLENGELDFSKIFSFLSQ